jgi:hypothetical protein
MVTSGFEESSHCDALIQPSNAGLLFCQGCSSAHGVVYGSAAAATIVTMLAMVKSFIFAFSNIQIVPKINWGIVYEEGVGMQQHTGGTRLYQYLRLPRSKMESISQW